MKRILTLGLLIALFTAGAAVLEEGRLRAEFDAQGGLAKLVLREGDQTVTLPVDPGRFWEAKALNRTFNAKNAKFLGGKLERNADENTYVARYEIGNRDYLLTLRYAIRRAADRQLRFRAEVTAKNPKRQIFPMHFSRIEGLPVHPQSYVVQAFRSGMIWRSDVVPFTERPAPGHMWMQMAGFYHPDFAVLLHCEDKDGFLKFNYLGRGRQGVFLGWRENMLLDGKKTYTMPYDYVVTLFPKGADYHDFAAVYADWARRQPWAQVSAAQKLALRPQLAKHVFNGVIKVCGFEGMGGDHYVPFARKQQVCRLSLSYEKAMECMRKFEELYQIAPGYRFDGWFGAHDVGYPDLLPVNERIGGMAGLQKFFDFTRERQMPLDYYVNPANYDEDAPSYRITKSVRQMDMEPNRYSLWNGSRLRWVSGKFMIEDTVPMLKQLERMGLYGGIFFDQLGGSSPFIDMNDHAGYEYYGRDSNHKGQLAAFHAFRTNFPKFSIGTEDGQEMMLADFDFTEAYARGDLSFEPKHRFSQGKSFLPLNELVYGDCFLNIMGIDGNNRLTADERRAVRVLYGLSLGCSMREELGYIPLRHADFERNDVIGEFATRRMARHEISPAGWRASLYPNGVIVSNIEGETQDITLTCALGKVEVKNLRRHGFAILTDNGKFSLWGGAELRLNGKTVVRVSNPDSVVTKNRRGIHLVSYGFVGIENMAEPYKFYSKAPWTLTVPGLDMDKVSLTAFPAPANKAAFERKGGDTIVFAAPGAEKSLWLK